MRRREFIGAVGGVAIACPFLARAQQLSVPVIGFLGSQSEQPDAPFVSAFRQGLVESGDVGKSAKIEFRWADNHADRLENLATDLIKLKPAVILAAGGSGTAVALKKLTSTIPIVFVMGTDPLKVGLVKSISRPEGNVTGVAFLATQIVAKRLELLLAFVPSAKRIAVLINPKNPELASMTRDVEAAERSLNITLQTYKASTEDVLDFRSRISSGHRALPPPSIANAMMCRPSRAFAIRLQKNCCFCFPYAFRAQRRTERDYTTQPTAVLSWSSLHPSTS
jgi:ABC-type uncharacterized transport system substrate-binding protein